MIKVSDGIEQMFDILSNVLIRHDSLQGHSLRLTSMFALGLLSVLITFN